jgi:Cobalt uptake substrate-specific transmembrane region
MKRALHTRMIPLLSVFAAFSFIIMMFNLPLPGGTTGHALGVGIAAIVLGPWYIPVRSYTKGTGHMVDTFGQTIAERCPGKSAV